MTCLRCKTEKKGIKKLLPTVEIGIQQAKCSLSSGVLPHHHAKRVTIFKVLSQMKAQDPHWNIVLYLSVNTWFAVYWHFSQDPDYNFLQAVPHHPHCNFSGKQKKNPELALPQHQEFTESKAVLLCELSGLPLCLLDLYEYVSSEQARAMNVATDSLQGKTDIRMYLTEDRLKNLSFGSILKM